jgi:hypothetical protein
VSAVGRILGAGFEDDPVMAWAFADPGRHVGGGEHLGQVDRRQRGRLRGERDDGVAADERRRQAGHEAEQRRLLGGDDADDADRLGRGDVPVRPGDRVERARHLRDLVGPAGVPDPTVDGLAHLVGGELRPPALEHLGDPVEDLPPVVGGLLGPPRLRGPGGAHGVAHVLAGALRDPLARGDGVGPPRLGPGELAADEQLVGLADRQLRGHDRASRAT